MAHDKVWVARRIDIANHWIATHPFMGMVSDTASYTNP